ncbi:Gfo/Idh/MocA family oxidoreductase [Actinocrinis sp.]|uniref:Gfo/Idh/MocA family protein n=1 Tax=Actinocrinis sp. TaxID=1920516 RepID=UPI002CD31922|nr:Gfo/Idh/MocA family oxidoreductase [Actinocrinis sp.]HXR70963.1 Gfo/Idh/MocA family oxidoreductase [Actinocrinis sp.]
MSPDRGPVRLGVIGCADIAVRRVLPAAREQAGLRLVAVSARDPRRAAQIAGAFGCAAEPDYQRLLERTDIEAVYIPLPVALHAPWALAALRHGKHVLVEKPLSTRADLAESVAGYAEERGLVLMENFMFAHHGRNHTARRLLGRGAIGPLRAFSAAFAVPPRPDGDIRLRPDLGGGSLFDIGVYPLRAAQFFLGPRLEVVGAHLDPGESGVDLGGAVLLRSPQGITAQLTFGMRHAYQSRYELWGADGRITADRAFTPPPDVPAALRVESGQGARDVLSPAQDQSSNTLRHFARAVRAAGRREFASAGRMASLRQAVELARLVDEVFARAGVPPGDARSPLAPGPVPQPRSSPKNRVPGGPR